MMISFNIILSSIRTSSKLPFFQVSPHFPVFRNLSSNPSFSWILYLFWNLQPVFLFLENQRFIQDINRGIYCYKFLMIEIIVTFLSSNENISWITFLKENCVILLRTVDFAVAVMSEAISFSVLLKKINNEQSFCPLFIAYLNIVIWLGITCILKGKRDIFPSNSKHERK